MLYFDFRSVQALILLSQFQNIFSVKHQLYFFFAFGHKLADFNLFLCKCNYLRQSAYFHQQNISPNLTWTYIKHSFVCQGPKSTQYSHSPHSVFPPHFLRVFTDFGSFWGCKTTKRALGARSVGLFQRVTFRLLEVAIVAFAVFTVSHIVWFVGLRHRACIVISLIEGFVATFVDQHQGIEFFFQ